MRRGARAKATSRDGNTALHAAAFFCQEEAVKFLLEKGCSPTRKNSRGETPIDTVSGDFDEGLAGLYKGIADAVGMEIDLQRIETARPKIADLLRKHAKEAAE